MKTKHIEQYLIKEGTTVRLAMKQLDSTHRKILFLIDENGKLLGSLSDGDIRRWILAEGALDVDVISACHLNSFAVREGYDYKDAKAQILKEKYSAVPIIDINGIIIDILFWDEILEESKLKVEYDKIDVEVVIMAGGQGTRLEPFTKILPKPLIPIGDKTIIEIIIDKFLDFKIDHFLVSVNHKAKIIKSYFEELSPEYSIEYIEEKMPLGTIGSLTLVKGRFNKPILITNCDIIIDANYSEFVEFHKKNKYDISLVASLMHHKIPYGICEIENGGTMTDFKEKPEYSFLASTGMYIINPELIELIPDNTFYHITHLMQQVRERGGKVGVFPISEDSWLDTGEWNEYKKTIEKFKI
ncbi:MAG: NTP transferase domain-containing protein [Bacteroidales bacterium]|nr:NTP transferase domain-containing protein [Bacteroidales bacterium]